jgi:NOL1/NOP2/sun family putative RNA methylase
VTAVGTFLRTAGASMRDVGLPGPFVERMRGLLGDEAGRFIDSLARPPERAVRANRLKLDPGELPAVLGVELEPVPWCGDAFHLPVGIRAGATPAHAAGLLYLQEPSALLPVEALEVRPGQRVLDLAAAPGGKTTQIAAKLGADGVVVANEVEPARLRALAENLDRWGSWRVAVCNEPVERLAGRLPDGFFDRVLLDAPCSGEGLFRRSQAARAQWRPGQVRGSAERQRHLLRQAARLVRPGGALVYSTCTFAPEENEQQVAAFLAEQRDWEVLEIPWREGFAPGRPDWCRDGQDAPAGLERTVRLWPHRVRGDGHFVARLGRRGERPPPQPVPAPRRRARERARAAAATLAAWEAFAAGTLREPMAAPLVVGERVYLAPDERLAATDLRWFRPGLPLGRCRPGRFEPAHALALALEPAAVRRAVRLDRRRAREFLRGETLPCDEPPGWALVTMGSWPLGWGRVAGGALKSQVPRGLRALVAGREPDDAS